MLIRYIIDAIGITMFFTLKEEQDDTVISPAEVLDWTLKNNKLPEFTGMNFTLTNGVLCGVIVPGSEQGKVAAEIAIDILNGKKPSDIPIVNLKTGISMINGNRAEGLNISIPEKLKQKSTIIH